MRKILIISGIRAYLILSFLPLIIKKEITFRQFIQFYKRVALYLKTFRNNKIFKKGKLLSIDPGIPRFGSSIFKKFCQKFLVFNQKLACSNVLLSVTKDCTFECKHCYQRDDIGEDVDISILKKAIEEIIDSGVTGITIEGGDPFLKFDRLDNICSTIGFDAEIIINSTGNGITLDRLKKLSSNSNIRMVMFSLNSPVKEDVNFFMGQDYAWNTLIHGSRLCNISSIDTGLNCCLQREDFYNGNIEYLMEKAKDLGVRLVNINLPKASGAWLKGGFQAFTVDDRDYIKDLVTKYNKKRRFRNYPAISAQIIEEDNQHHGCTAGGTNRFYINAKGDVQPCQFLNISFGNIANEHFIDIYNRMRKEFDNPGINWLCDSNSQIIHKLYQEEGSLPLSVDNSAKVVSNWNLGDSTPLYNKLEKEFV